MKPEELPDYPLPDPEWDYAELWKHAQDAKSEIEKLIQYMASVEDATVETDKEIRVHSEWAQTHLRLLLGKLPFSS